MKIKLKLLLSLLLVNNISLAHPLQQSLDTESNMCLHGQAQSPIDIIGAVNNRKLPPMKFSYAQAQLTEIVHQTDVLKFNLKPNSAALTYNNRVYHLKQFHLHKPSEHTIEGITYPLEWHFVHQADDGKILVIAVLVKKGNHDSYLQQQLQVTQLPKVASLKITKHFNPEKLYPRDQAYYHYSGSLTTPPCTEPVEWLVFQHPITMSNAEIETLTQYLPEPNARAVQPLHNRQISHN